MVSIPLYIYMCVYMCVYIYICVCIYIYIYMCVCVYIYIPLYIYMCVCVCVYIYISLYTHTDTHTQNIFSFIYWWTLGLLPYLGYCKEWRYEQWDAYIFSKWCFHFFFSVIFPRVELLDHIVVLFLVFWAPSYCFPQWLHQFTFPSTRY